MTQWKTKPFDMDLLSIQIQNIMHNHNIVKKHYATIAVSYTHLDVYKRQE